jgi:3-oxoacyl-[acyl-carrier-protein] synthase III
MDGPAVFKKGIEIVTKSIMALLKKHAIDPHAITYFIAHQANIRILESVAKKLGIPFDRFLINIDSVGNTSAASIPLILSEHFDQNTFKKGDTLCLLGFGAGFTWSSILLEWSESYEHS